MERLRQRGRSRRQRISSSRRRTSSSGSRSRRRRPARAPGAPGARPRPEASLAQAQAELTGIGRQLAEEHSVENATIVYRVVPLQDSIVGPIRPMLWLLAGAVEAVLLVACGNVAMLLLAHAQTRRREFAVRAALGGAGAQYEILGPLTGPNGHTAWVRTIWIILTGETAPRLVTLIPAVKP